MPDQQPPNQELNFTFTGSEIQPIADYLGDRPFHEVAGLIQILLSKQGVPAPSEFKAVDPDPNP